MLSLRAAPKTACGKDYTASFCAGRKKLRLAVLSGAEAAAESPQSLRQREEFMTEFSGKSGAGDGVAAALLKSRE